MIYTLILANHAQEPHRKKEGDIVAICPHSHEGGRKARKQYFYILVDFENIFNVIAEARKFQVPLYDDGEIWYPSDDVVEPAMIAKNRYQISFSEIDLLAVAEGVNIDWKKVRDESVDYQPLLDDKIIFDWGNLIHNKASGLKMDKEALETIRDYGKFEEIGN